VPVLATVALGSVELVDRRSTTSVSTPYEPSVTAVASGTGPDDGDLELLPSHFPLPFIGQYV
jgi:hypothetical protein